MLLLQDSSRGNLFPDKWRPGPCMVAPRLCVGGTSTALRSSCSPTPQVNTPLQMEAIYYRNVPFIRLLQISQLESFGTLCAGGAFKSVSGHHLNLKISFLKWIRSDNNFSLPNNFFLIIINNFLQLSNHHRRQLSAVWVTQYSKLAVCLQFYPNKNGIRFFTRIRR